MSLSKMRVDRKVDILSPWPLEISREWKEKNICSSPRARCVEGKTMLREGETKGGRGQKKRAGGGQGETAGGHSPAASNRKGKTPGEHELVFGDIVVTCRWRKHDDDDSGGVGVQLTLSLSRKRERERKDIFPKSISRRKFARHKIITVQSENERISSLKPWQILRCFLDLMIYI